MRFERLFVPVVLLVMSASGAAHANPDDPNLRFWVQLNKDPAMLHDLVMGDHRINPIIIVRSPNVVGPCSNPQTWCPSTAACNAKAQLDVVFANMTPPAGGSGFPIALMIQRFGDGGRSRATTDEINDFPAPALVRPPLLNLSSSNPCPPANTNDPTLAANNDYIRPLASTTCPCNTTNTNIGCGYAPYWSPWPTLGPTDCADWLRDFASAYTGLVSGSVDFQPKRLILDSEADVAPVFWSQLDAMRCSLLTDPLRSGQPVKGTKLNGVYCIHTGQTIGSLDSSFAPDCDNCPAGDPGPPLRLWMANIMRQAQVAAFQRAIKEPESTTQLGAILPSPLESFPDPFNSPKWSNFSFSSTDGQIDANYPPYDKNGNAVRKVAYRDRLYYESYHNFADFSSPVSYSFPRNQSSDLQGRTRSEWVLQSTRELLDSILFSPTPAPCPSPDPLPTIGAMRDPEYITPWIAVPNLYFVSMDHHRKLLALMRAKQVREHNLFVDVDVATHVHAMANWTALRHVVDQVWGFDIDQGYGSVNGTLITNGPPGSASFNALKWADGLAMKVVAGTIPSDEPYASTPYERLARITTSTKVSKPFTPTDPTAPTLPDNHIAMSDNLRINIEYNAPTTVYRPDDAPPGLNDDIELQVSIWRADNQVWTSVLCDSVGSSTGSGPTANRRYVKTVTIPNPSGRYVDFSSANTNQVGDVKIKVGLRGTGQFTVSFDLVQVVGVDNLPSCPELDWNHDGIVGIADVLSFVEDFQAFYATVSNQPRKTDNELWALDANGDGWVDSRDLCAFETLVDACSPLTKAEIMLFMATIEPIMGSQSGPYASPCNLAIPSDDEGP